MMRHYPDAAESKSIRTTPSSRSPRSPSSRLAGLGLRHFSGFCPNQKMSPSPRPRYRWSISGEMSRAPLSGRSPTTGTRECPWSSEPARSTRLASTVSPPAGPRFTTYSPSASSLPVTNARRTVGNRSGETSSRSPTVPIKRTQLRVKSTNRKHKKKAPCFHGAFKKF